MDRKLPVLINRSGGTASARGARLADDVEEAFAAIGCKIDLRIIEASAIPAAVRAVSSRSRIVIGGGDGTLGAAAGELAGLRCAMAILPLGTRNHLARQLGVPLDLAAAARLAMEGERKRIDIGQAGERVFVNNASFGLYTRFVRARDRMGGPKWLDTLPALWHALRHMRARHFSLEIDGNSKRLSTPLLFIGNNRYSLEPGKLGERDSLTDGELSISAVSATSPQGLLAFGVRAVCGRADPRRDFEVCAPARELIIEGAGHIEAGFDGELARVELPLRIRILPRALGVVVPRESAQALPAIAVRQDKMGL